MMARYQKSSFFVAVLVGLAGSACAKEKVSHEGYWIGMDFGIRQAELIPYYKDEPPYGIGRPLGGQGGISSNINANNSFVPGTTSVKLQFRFLPDPEVDLVPQVRVRFHYWPEDEWVTAFEETSTGYATDITFTRETDEEGHEIVRVAEDIQGQPWLTATPVRKVDGPDGWYSYALDLKSDFDFPEREWTTGQQLDDNAKTRKAVEAEFRKAYDIFAQKDPDKTFQFYKPQMIKDGASYGDGARKWFDYIFPEMVAESSTFEPFDASGAELQIYGDGRLATLYPSPVQVKINTGQIFTPFLYFWKDAEGNWHPRD